MHQRQPRWYQVEGGSGYTHLKHISDRNVASRPSPSGSRQTLPRTTTRTRQQVVLTP